MSFDAHKNFAHSAVAMPPSPPSSGTTLTVRPGDGALFPAPPFNVVIWAIGGLPTHTNAEILRVTGISGDTLTVTRAQESSSARAVIVGDQVSAAITAKTLTDAEAAITSEIARAESAEAANASAIAAETSRAEAAEAATASALATETTRAEAAETANSNAITAEAERAEAAEALALAKASNLSDIPNAATARTNLGLGSAAVQPTSAFDAAGTAASLVTSETNRAQAAEALLVPSSLKGVALGVATLDRNATLTLGQIPASVLQLGSAFSGQIIGGSGSNGSVALVTPTSGQLLQLQVGSSGSPDATLAPVGKVVRTMSIQSAAVVGDGSEQCAAFTGIALSDANNQIQTVGLLGQAQNAGTAKGSTDSPDACAVYGVGRIDGSGIGVAIGGFFNALMKSTSALGSGLQVNVRNDTGADNTLNLTGFPTSCGAWLTTNGTNRAGVGIAFGNPFGQQYDFGIHFNAQVAGGLTGPTKTCDIRSDSNAARGLFLNGTYSTTAIAVGSTAGTTLLGGSTAAAGVGCLLEVQGPARNVNPIVSIGSTANNNVYRVKLRNSSGNGDWFVSAGSNNVLTGTIAGDTGFVQNTTATFFHIGGQQSVIKVGQDNSLSFNNSTGVTARTGWTPWTGTATRTSFATGTATVQNVAEALKALLDDLHSRAGYGLLTT